MQQGKMFFFIGLIMALVQGGYVRRVKRGKEVKVVSQVIVFPVMHLAALLLSVLSNVICWLLVSKVARCFGLLCSLHAVLVSENSLVMCFVSNCAKAFADFVFYRVLWC
jgi:hypothetical protein